MFIKRDFQEKSILLYQGALTVNLVSILGNQVRLLLAHDLKGVQKIFRVFVELAQNVSYYSAESYETGSEVYCGAGWISVQDLSNEYHITTGNRIKPEDAPTLIRHCNEINALDEDELRKLKRDLRSQAMVRDTGAHIGLIQSCIVSGNPLDFLITEEDGYHYFTLRVRLAKEEA
jgi:hypothetical protein